MNLGKELLITSFLVLLALSGCTDEPITPNPDVPSSYLYTNSNSVVSSEKRLDRGDFDFREIFDPVEEYGRSYQKNNSFEIDEWKCKGTGKKIEGINYFTSECSLLGGFYGMLGMSGACSMFQRGAFSCEEYYIISEFSLSGPQYYGPFGEVPETPEINCAKGGENFSKVYTDEYPEICCKGFTEWDSGFDTRISVAGNCYETRLVAGSPVGTCIKCGDNICNKSEDVCNCPEDCSGGEESDYKTVEDFCENWENSSMASACQEVPDISELSICDLCESEPKCDELDGNICDSDESCSTQVTEASDSEACCLGVCEPIEVDECQNHSQCNDNDPSTSDVCSGSPKRCHNNTLKCGDRGGVICTSDQTCSRSFITAANTDKCCSGVCEEPVPVCETASCSSNSDSCCPAGCQNNDDSDCVEVILTIYESQELTGITGEGEYEGQSLRAKFKNIRFGTPPDWIWIELYDEQENLILERTISWIYVDMEFGEQLYKDDKRIIKNKIYLEEYGVKVIDNIGYAIVKTFDVQNGETLQINGTPQPF